MKHVTIFLGLIAAAAGPCFADVYEPVVNPAAADARPFSITVQGDQSSWNVPLDGNPTTLNHRYGGLIAADFEGKAKSNSSHSGAPVLGFWYASDSESYAELTPLKTFPSGNASLDWYEGHVGYVFGSADQGALGGQIGYLTTTVGHGLANMDWITASLVGSTRFAGMNGKPGPFSAGGTFGLASDTSGIGSPGIEYSVSAAYAFTANWSLNGSYWRLYEFRGDSPTRTDAGVAYRF